MGVSHEAKMAASREKRKQEVVLKELEDEKRLVEAAKSGDRETAALLIESGVSVDVVDYNKHLFYQSENYMTPLQFATAEGFPELVRLFIESDGKRESQQHTNIAVLASFNIVTASFAVKIIERILVGW